MKCIRWNQNGWTTLQEADGEKHILEIAIRAEEGIVKEVRRRHSHGEEEILTGALEGEFSLPMAIDDFKKAYKKGLINLK